MIKKNIEFSSECIADLLSRHVPCAAVAYCLELWHHHPFSLKITQKRKTKHGDYHYHKIQQTHVITVNGTLNRYAFLITYIHEVAHLYAFLKYGYQIAPHGAAWKQTFQRLMCPLLNQKIFPPDILPALSRHMQRPKASSSTDPKLVMALQTYDQTAGAITLASVPLKQTFCFHQRIFTKDEVKRTRAWCTEVKSGRRYTIPIAALVEIAS